MRALLFTGLLSIFCLSESAVVAAPPDLNPIAEQYVKLVLAMGQHDPDYVDAYYGPAEWKTESEKAKKPLDVIEKEATALLQKLGSGEEAGKDEMLHLRHQHLLKQLKSLITRVHVVHGEKLSFDDEAQGLYDAVAPKYTDQHFQEVMDKLAAKLPGTGPLWRRYEDWRRPFMVPNEKLNAVFQAAIRECRNRTLTHISLPLKESFAIEYVTDKPWGGYNWYQGNFHSLIQVNTDLPTFIDRAVDLAAHEGYPGHHVYNTLLEQALVRDRGWVEFAVYPLFSAQSLIAEGTANFGRDLVFTKAERQKFEKEILFPAAGIDPKRADEYYEVQEMMKELGYAVTEIARRLINGEVDETAAAKWLEKFTVNEPARAAQRVRFIQRYRSYVINYSLGEDMVEQYVDRAAGVAKTDQPTPEEQEKRWKVFAALLASPKLPGDLK